MSFLEVLCTTGRGVPAFVQASVCIRRSYSPANLQLQGWRVVAVSRGGDYFFLSTRSPSGRISPLGETCR